MKENVKKLLRLVELYDETRKLHMELYGELGDIRDVAKVGKFDLKEMIDRIYVMRETARVLDDLRKEATGISQVLEKIACLLWVQQNQNNPKPEPIRTALCTGTPDVGMQAKVPKKKTDPEAYAKLMKFLGVPDELAEKEIVRTHWPSMVEYLTSLASQGRPLPDGIAPTDTYPVYSIKVLMRMGLDEVSHLLQEAAKKTAHDAEAAKEDACEQILTIRRSS